MNSPRASCPTSKAVNAFPTAFGLLLPSNPEELLRLLRSRKQSSIARDAQAEQEKMENKLMGFEDVVYMDDAKLLAMRMEEEMKMAAEDMVSTRIEAEYRVFLFKAKIQAEVAARKLAEENEKVTKRRLAEERRMAVVARIKLAKEEEERKAKEAEVEEQKRLQESIRLLAIERSGFAMEDELSSLVENEIREMKARAEWLRKEMLKQEELEAIQREKDRLSEIEREKRMSELEEKKRKLKELKESQETNSSTATAARQEAAKLNKQMRIQNKAKYVTKKIKAGTTDSARSETVALPSVNLSSSIVQPDDAKHNTSDELQTVEVEESFLAVIGDCKDENDVRQLEKALMLEKRGLRLKLQQLQQQQKQQNIEQEDIAVVQKQLQVLYRKETKLHDKLAELKSSEVHVKKQEETGEKDKSNSLFKKIEQLLREANQMLASGVIQVDCQQRAVVLAMELSEMMKQLAQIKEDLGYRDKLEGIMSKLRDAPREEALSSTQQTILPEAAVEISTPVCKVELNVVAVTKTEESTPKESPKLNGNDVPILNTKSLTNEMVSTTGDVSTKTIDRQDSLGVESLNGFQDCLYTSMATAAHHAAYYGHTEVLEALTQLFDCFVVDKKGRSPLFYAALANRLDCVAILVCCNPQWIDVGDEVGDTPIHAAALSNGSDVLGFLLQSCEVSPDTANYEGLTPCHLASSSNALKVLYNHGAMPYCVDTKNRLPNHLASLNGRLECVQFLCSVTPSQFLMWADCEGNTCLHVAASNGHDRCVEEICRWVQGVEDFCIPNKKSYTAAHVSTSSSVLKVLYEYGADLWVLDSKQRYPLFLSCFFGRVDCVSFLLEVASSSNKLKLVSSADIQGDTALHAACLCGQLPCVELLLYFLRDSPNKQGILCSQLADRANHTHIANLIRYADTRLKLGELPEIVFGGKFDILSSVLLHYGSRWTKLYDYSSDSVYYFDRTSSASQWERPDSFDENPKLELQRDKARLLLKEFYTRYNDSKLKEVNDILLAYENRYTELFISLANKYELEDLSMFAGISFD